MRVLLLVLSSMAISNFNYAFALNQFEYVSPAYLKSSDEYGKHLKALSYKNMEVKESDFVLDFGCGIGSDLLALANLVTPD
ncbi:hypothetical protein [Orientia tsutsugamushi]|uniref:hypothetical protein n=1 Tax=Orientia tsutsugamushi TaxID=784 RepID=UPI000D5A6499|nr:Uncharacterised protein [Orientia tsutsugamushi]